VARDDERPSTLGGPSAARIDQRQSVIDALNSSVSATEEATLPRLRDDLIMADRETPATQPTRRQVTCNRLRIDTRADGCQMTTRVAQAIETLQGVLWAVRTGRSPT